MAKKYLITFIVSTLGFMLLAMLGTALVDPYGLYGLIKITGFNQQKEGVRGKIRFVKSLELPLRKPNTLLMGSSRVHDGINPNISELKQFENIYNYAVDMNRIYETRLLVQHATENSKIKHLILGLDFFMFNSLQRKNGDFDEALIGHPVLISDYLVPTLLSRNAVIDSYKTVKQSMQQPNRNEFLGNGFRPQAFYGLKNYPGGHYYTNYIFLSPQQSDTLYYSKMQADDQVYNELIKLLDLCRSKGIDVHLFINPAHASLDGEGIRAVGKWAMFENWKRKLTSISESYAVDLWDFSGYNSITTERVSTPMNYYWDSSHYTELVGGYMMSRMFEPHNYKGPRDFGFQLTSKNIEGHLKSIRDDRERYAQANRSYIDSLNYHYKAIIDGAPLDQIRVKDMY